MDQGTTGVRVPPFGLNRKVLTGVGFVVACGKLQGNCMFVCPHNVFGRNPPRATSWCLHRPKAKGWNVGTSGVSE